MASKLSELTAADALTGTELLELVQDGSNRKGLVSDLLTYLKANSLFYVTLVFAGEATDEQVFDYFKAHGACEVIGMQISAQEAPTGSNLTIDLVDGADAEQSKVGTLNTGSKFQETIFGAVLALAEDGVIKGKIKSVGSVLPGTSLSIKLICRPT